MGLPQYPPPQQQHQPPQSSAPVPIIPKPDAPSKPHAHNGLEAYYPKAHFIHGDFGGLKIPPVVGRAVILDDGNASPHMWASTMYAIPSDSTTLKHTGFSEIPLMVTPLALPSQEYNGTVGQADHLPESGRLGYIALDTEAPQRCTHCYAYANPLMIVSGKCNFCNGPTSGSRKNVGTVDYPVDGPYVTRAKPVQPHILWAIDLTAPKCLEYLRLLIHHVLPTWKQHQVYAQSLTKHEVTSRAGIVLVSARGVYLPVKGNVDNMTQPPFFIMPDVADEPFAPMPLSEFTYDLHNEWNELQESWQDLLDTVVPELRKAVGSDRLTSDQPLCLFSCGGAALGMMVDALQESGGRAVWVSWRRPNYGVGKLVDRQVLAKEESYLSKEYSLYTPGETDTFYKELATTAAKSQVAVDVVFMTDPSVPHAYMDIATLQQVCQTTNGRLTWINSKIWENSFVETLIRPLQFTGCDAVLKVRVSNGLRVKSLECAVGNVRQSASLTDDSPELELAVVTPDTTVGVYLQHRVGGLPKNSQFVYIQSALLYTNPWNGQRRVRVSTLALRVAPNAQQVFSSMEFNTLAASMMRQVVTKVRTAKDGSAIQEAREQAHDQCVSILTNYRKYGASLSSQASGSTQLMLPDKLTLLPLFVMSLLKSPLLRASISRRNTTPDPLADDRAYQLYYASQVSPSMALWTVFPLIVDLHASVLGRWQHPGLNLPDDAHRLDILKQGPYLALPDPIMASMSELQDDHTYLLVTPLKFYVVIGKDVTKEVVQELQAVIRGEETDEDTIGGNMTRLLKQVKAWNQVGCEPRWLRPTCETIEMVSPQQVASWWVADPTRSCADYLTFLTEIQRSVMAACTK
jgi:Sec23/Sec24 helical domain/Sec23/Sec24 beta-sandwich domain/Sec23/Sec24 trunk domain